MESEWRFQYHSSTKKEDADLLPEGIVIVPTIDYGHNSSSVISAHGLQGHL